MTRLLKTVAFAAVLLASPATRAQTANDDPLARALKAELARAMRLEVKGASKPYYVGYQVVDRETSRITAEFGGIVTDGSERERILRVDLRIGDYDSDSSKFRSLDLLTTFAESRSLSLDDNELALRRSVWLATDRAYKVAAEQLAKKRGAMSKEVADKNRPPDFSKEASTRFMGKERSRPVPSKAWRATVRKLGSLWWKHPHIQEGTVSLIASRTRRYFVSSERSESKETSTLVRLVVAARTQATDGASLTNYVAFVVPTLADLPSEAEIIKATNAMLAELTAMRTAPVVNDYTGPVLLEGAAAAQMVSAVLVPSFSGTPPPRVSEPRLRGLLARSGSALAGKLGKRALPAQISVVDDPTRQRFGKYPLIGAWAVDDEGIRSQRARLVGRGVLKTLVMSRTPGKKLRKSTGHARNFGLETRAHASNVIVSARRGATQTALRRRLIQLARRAGESYGIVVRRLDDPVMHGMKLDRVDFLSSMILTMRGGGTPVPSALVAYKVTPDGKETLVRGVRFKGVDLRALRNIAAVGKTAVAHNYLAQAGGLLGMGTRHGVPSSVVAPSLLFKELEVRSSPMPAKALPLIPRPAP